MKADDVLSHAKEKVLLRWEELSLAKISEAQKLSRTAIRDHIPQVFTALCAVLKTGVLKIPEELSKTHGRQRSWSTDYSLAEVMSEYSILKNVIFDELTFSGSASLDEFRMIGQFFDATSTIATTEFVKNREHELNLITDSLVAINLELETFAAVAAHDLRAPTSTILGFADLIFENAKVEDELAVKAVHTIKKTAHRMLELIDQLLSYAKMGKEYLTRANFSLKTVVLEAKENLTTQIQETGAKINIEDLPAYEGDPVLFRQLFQNLLSNCLKFSDKQRPCQISITSSTQKNQIQLRIKDNGAGFDPKLNEVIFQPFKRGNNRSDIQGSGLGLATAKKIVELHGGKISARGQIDQGAEISIDLPIRN